VRAFSLAVATERWVWGLIQAISVMNVPAQATPARHIVIVDQLREVIRHRCTSGYSLHLMSRGHSSGLAPLRSTRRTRFTTGPRISSCGST
jgi:hypothetical protein